MCNVLSQRILSNSKEKKSESFWSSIVLNICKYNCFLLYLDLNSIQSMSLIQCYDNTEPITLTIHNIFLCIKKNTEYRILQSFFSQAVTQQLSDSAGGRPGQIYLLDSQHTVQSTYCQDIVQSRIMMCNSITFCLVNFSLLRFNQMGQAPMITDPPPKSSATFSKKKGKNNKNIYVYIFLSHWPHDI